MSITSDRYTLLLHWGPNVICLSKLQGETCSYLSQWDSEVCFFPAERGATGKHPPRLRLVLCWFGLTNASCWMRSLFHNSDLILEIFCVQQILFARVFCPSHPAWIGTLVVWGPKNPRQTNWKALRWLLWKSECVAPSEIAYNRCDLLGLSRSWKLLSSNLTVEVLCNGHAL